MKVFFDNCTSPTLAATLNGYLSMTGGQAVHIKDLPCGRHAPDLVWIDHLRGTGDEWLVVTGDLRLQRVKAQRLAFRQAHLRGIVLASAYQSFRVDRQASFLLWRWSDIEDLVRLTAPPFLFEMPAHRSSGMRSLPL